MNNRYPCKVVFMITNRFNEDKKYIFYVRDVASLRECLQFAIDYSPYLVSCSYD